jgi:hypothetical protein
MPNVNDKEDQEPSHIGTGPTQSHSHSLTAEEIALECLQHRYFFHEEIVEVKRRYGSGEELTDIIRSMPIPTVTAIVRPGTYESPEDWERWNREMKEAANMPMPDEDDTDL